MNTDELESGIRRVDKGAEWGTFDGKEAEWIFHRSRPYNLRILVSELIKKYAGRVISFADVGGGTGDISLYVQSALEALLSNKAPRLSIDVYDIDSSKFKNNMGSNIAYIEQDIRLPLPKSYDVVFSQFVLHYNPLEDQEKIFDNLARASRGVLNIMDNVPIDEKNRIKFARASEYLARVTGCNVRYWHSRQSFREMVQAHQPDKLQLTAYLENPCQVSATDFFKERYGINPEQVKILDEKIGHEPIYMNMTTALFTAKEEH